VIIVSLMNIQKKIDFAKTISWTGEVVFASLQQVGIGNQKLYFGGPNRT